jgi:hypothetical protein
MAGIAPETTRWQIAPGQDSFTGRKSRPHGGGKLEKSAND